MKTIYINDFGQKFTFKIQRTDGTLYNLTGHTVSINFYSQGSNDLKLTDSMTIEDASAGKISWTSESSDFDSVGMYYTKYIITETSTGDTITLTGEIFEVIENNKNIVTYNEFKNWLRISDEYMPPYDVVMNYLEEAETDVDTMMTSTVNTTNTDYIKIKKRLIKLSAGSLLFLNMDEGGLNPELRQNKSKEYMKRFNDLLNSYLNRLGSSKGGIRKVIDTKKYNLWGDLW